MVVSDVLERLARRPPPGLMPLSEALSALGQAEVMGRRHGEVPVGQVVGSFARAGDFDERFRLRNAALRERWPAGGGPRRSPRRSSGCARPA